MSYFYIITYDLRTPGKDYTSLYAAIKMLTSEWKHPIESTWVVRTDKNANVIYNSLRETLDRNDRIFITKIDPSDKQGWMDVTFWNWINQPQSYD